MLKDEDKSREQLIIEIQQLRKKIEESNAIVRDIAKYKNAEEALKEQLHFLQLLINTIPNPVFYKDTLGLFRGCNTAFEQLVGLPREKIVGKSAHDIYPPDFADRYSYMDTLLFRKPGIQAYESPFPCPDGMHNMLFNKAAYLNTGGEAAGLVGVIIDITERKQTEAALRNNERFLNSIFDSILDPFSIIDKDFNIIRINSKTQELFNNYAPLIGKKCYEVFHYSPVICDGCPSVQTLKTGQAAQAIVPKKGPGGEIFGWEKHYSYPFVDMATNQLNGVIIYVRDITAKLEVEQEMARLERLNLIGEMAAGIGHEVRNPMTTVRGFLQLLGNKQECARYRDFYDLMIEELDRANSIISEFLSLAKNRPVDLRPVNLNSVVNTLLPLIMADAANLDKNIKTELETIPSILLDEKEIRQLILNLVRNGLEAMSPGGSLTIKTSSDSTGFELSVADQGEGIKHEHLRRIGTPFFTTKENGTGLGLAVCYSIAARHNASIKVDTCPNGTTFSVKFRVR
ncbi:MAG: PAS domain S-box protein [Actinobacteria bacterium]|nr:PAS domain S-box protein [Actinomycetota bacterium]